MRVVFLFLDGVGLGEPDPSVNPLAAAPMPTLQELLDGHIPTATTPHIRTTLAAFTHTDATLGVPGIPQSATGQATLLTGRNVPALIGEHYGPRPDARIRPLLERDTLFHRARAAGKCIAFANAYPERYFRYVNSGRRLPGAMAYTARAAGIRLRNAEDLRAGHAISVDFTNRAWREQLGYPDMPLRTPEESGHIVADLAREHDLVIVEQWATDVAGHRRDWEAGLYLLTALDAFLAGLLAHVDLDNTLILITSDHGNLEDMRTRRHTTNPVPTVLIGARAAELAEPHLSLDRVYTLLERALLDPAT